MSDKRMKIIGSDGKELTDISGKSIATQLPEGVDLLKGIWKSEELLFTAKNKRIIREV